jgi:hypothetical protein
VSVEYVKAVLDHSQASGLARLVLVVLSEHRNQKTGRCDPNIETIARRARCSRASVFRALEELERLGELRIQRTRGRKRKNHYTVLVGEKVSARNVFAPRERSHLGEKISHPGTEKFSRVRPEPEENQKRTGRERESAVADAPLSRATRSQNGSDGDPAPGEGRGADLIALWNATSTNLPPAAATPDRLRAAAQRLREQPDLEQWRTACRKINASPFCCGRNERGWRATIDFLLKPGRLTRVLEGAYDDAAALRSQAILEWLRARGEERRKAAR